MSFRNFNNRENYKNNNNFNQYNNNNNRYNTSYKDKQNDRKLEIILKDLQSIKRINNNNNFLIFKLENKVSCIEKFLISTHSNVKTNKNQNEKILDTCKNDEDDINYDFEVFQKEIKLDKEEDFEELDINIKNIDDIIKLSNKFQDQECTYYFNKEKNLHFYNNKYFSFNPIKIKNLLNPMKKLKNLIGIDCIKDSIINFITTYLSNQDENKNMLHTIIEGPPGVGKTRLGKILAEIYSALGVVNSSRFKLVKRSDLVGQYAGETVNKTQKVLDESEGGVLFIDEAYSLGSDGNDLYSKECINCINQNLTEKKKNLIVIIAGYENALEKYFFSKNEGLKRRFPFKYKILGYNKNELMNIFILGLKYKKLKLNSKEIDEKKIIKLFEENPNAFKNFGGDIENLINYCELNVNRENFGKHPNLRKIINLKILKKSINDYLNVINDNEDNTWKDMIYI